MNLMVDTHILLWWLSNPAKLSDAATQAIANPQNNLFVSSAVIWEIRIKETLKKLVIPSNFDDALSSQGFQDLPIQRHHVNAITSLPTLHKDPFDRIQIAQAIVENMPIVSMDPEFKRYSINVVG